MKARKTRKAKPRARRRSSASAPRPRTRARKAALPEMGLVVSPQATTIAPEPAPSALRQYARKAGEIVVAGVGAAYDALTSMINMASGAVTEERKARGREAAGAVFSGISSGASAVYSGAKAATARVYAFIREKLQLTPAERSIQSVVTAATGSPDRTVVRVPQLTAGIASTPATQTLIPSGGSIALTPSSPSTAAPARSYGGGLAMSPGISGSGGLRISTF